MLIFEENNQRKLKKNFQYSPPHSKYLHWKYQKSKNSRSLIQCIHRKFKKKNKWPCSSREGKITIKGWDNKGKLNKENEEDGEKEKRRASNL